MATSKKPTKKAAKAKSNTLAEQLKKQGFKMPHGYDIALRKRKK